MYVNYALKKEVNAKNIYVYIYIPRNMPMPPVVIYPRKILTWVIREQGLVIAAWVIKARSWEPPKCSSAGPG